MKIKRNSPYFKGAMFDEAVIILKLFQNIAGQVRKVNFIIKMDYSSGISDKVKALEKF